jgi:hypothetical protein
MEKKLREGLKEARVLTASDDWGVVVETKHHPKHIFHYANMKKLGYSKFHHSDHSTDAFFIE